MSRLGLGAVSVVVLLCVAMPAWAGRPLAIDDAAPVDKGHFELELGVEYEDNGGDHWNFPLGLTYGLIENLEVGVGFGGQIEQSEELLGNEQTDENFSDIAVGAKWRYVTQEQLLVDQSLAATAVFPVREENVNEYDLTWIATRQWTEQFGSDLNFGYTWVADDDIPDFVHYGVAVRYQLTERLEPVAEIFADTPVSGDEETAAAINVGIRWLVIDSLTVDASVGAGITEEAPDWLAKAGLTWAF